MSFEHIRSSDRKASDLLSLMSYFDRQGIHQALLQRKGQDVSDRKPSGAKLKLGMDDFEDSSDSDSSVDDDIDVVLLTLRNFSLIEVTREPKVFEMHSLIQLATRTWLETEGQRHQWLEQVVDILYDAFPEIVMPST